MKPFDRPLRIRTCLLSLLAVSLCFASERPTDRLLWILSRVDSLPAANSGGIAHCQRMEQCQRQLLSQRDSISRIRVVGRSRQLACRNQETDSASACPATLQILRDSLKALSQRESLSSEEVGLHSAKCPSATWSQWLRYRQLDSLLATSTPDQPVLQKASWIQELAELGWRGNLDEILRSPGSTALRIDPYVLQSFQDPTTSARWRLRKAFLLEWSHRTDSARTILESLLSSTTASVDESALAHFWLGSDPSQPDSLRSKHIQASLDRVDLRGRGLYELAPLLANASRWKDAFDSLSVALRLEGSLVDSFSISCLASWADRAKIDPFESPAKSSPGWQDQPQWQDQLWIARARLLLDSGRARAAQALLADFRLRFPQSSRSDVARELLARSRR